MLWSYSVFELVSCVCVRTVVDIIQSVVVLGSWLCPICSSSQLVVFVYTVLLVC